MGAQSIMLLALITWAGLAAAQPALVGVKLPAVVDLKSWRAAGLPTLELFGETAIAAVDESRLPALARAGYDLTVIERPYRPGEYFVIEASPGKNGTVLGQTLWTGSGLMLVRATTDWFRAMKARGMTVRPLKDRPLPERFWRDRLSAPPVLRALLLDPYIQGIVDQVSADSIAAVIIRLQEFQTRFSLTDSCRASAAWLKQRLEGYGYPAEYDSFYVETWPPGAGYERNVIGTSPGSANPANQIIISGHFDAITYENPLLIAPGANDDATGTAITLEAARILRTQTMKQSVKFCCWSGEEQAVVGSSHYAAEADSLGREISAVINMDEVGYRTVPYNGVYMGQWQGAHQWLADLYVEMAGLYAPSLAFTQVSTAMSDHYPFIERGYPAICVLEYDPLANPNHHTPTDLYNTLTPDLFTEIARASIATTALLAISPTPVGNPRVRDAGTGTELLVSWDPNPDNDISGYWVRWGHHSQVYTDSSLVAGTDYLITGLTADTIYYATVRAVNAAGYQSLIAQEMNGVPRSAPWYPAGFAAEPIDHGIRMFWRRNTELDFAGCRIYRKVNDQPAYDSLNTTLFTDTTLAQQGLSGADKYYYAIRAFDTLGNYGPMSPAAYCRPLTLDQGILIIDETQNWVSGNFPRDTAQDRFYNYVLQDYPHQLYEFGQASERPVLGDFAPYSTVAWFADDYGQPYAGPCAGDLGRYLSLGGRILYAGWKPLGSLAALSAYPDTFLPGNPAYDVLKIAGMDLSAATDSFQGAAGQLGYPAVSIDPAKVPLASWGGTLRYIEGYEPAPGGDVIYRADFRNSSSSFQGRPCGIRNLGSIQTVFLGFPLYFLNQEQARQMAQRVMSDFGEVGVQENPKSKTQNPKFVLEQSIPNPFAEQTVISFQLPQLATVSLKVYNIVGQAVKTLIDGRIEAGSHWAAWDGRDDRGTACPNGVYFYSLTSDGWHRTGRMMRIR